ncbi:biopolymer transporter Tol [Frigoribacterium sp. 2-23]|uniref:TolB family protein n=1 Tax=Frigoribacterium sp. 2-23 TaxID=3415006 RepID=UPI003C6FDC50
MPRTLLPGQTCRLLIVDPATGHADVVFESATLLVEAPNWSPDGRWLVVNGDGLLWRLAVDGSSSGVLEPVALGDVPEINNDHVIAPDQGSVFVSARDGHLYEVPWDGVAPGSSARRVTLDHPEDRDYKNYLHGVSPDGATLSVIVGALPAVPGDPAGGAGESAEEARRTWQTNVALVSVADGSTAAVTSDGHPDDGVEYSPDGQWLWFNSERASDAPGHAQLFRASLSGDDVTQITFDAAVNWFPHVSPDGTTLLWLAYEPGTLGHPENRDVVLRTMALDGGLPAPGAAPRDVLRLFGGQGTTNVPGWSPDSHRFACVEYPLS